MRRVDSPRGKVAVAMSTVLLAFTLAGCAPEASEIAGSTEKDTQTINPESEASEREVTEYDYSTEIPESFPSDEFALPQDVIIQDVGESGTDRWFIVLLAPDSATADAWWAGLIETNGFSVSDQSDTSEGGLHAFLNGVTMQIEALTIPQSDGSVQLSYSIARWV